MDGLELCVSDGDLGKAGHIGAIGEGEQILDGAGDASVVRCDVVGAAGPKLPPPIQTCSVRQCPAETGSLWCIRAACIARIALSSSRSASATAAFMASVLLTIRAALRRLVSPSASASAIARAEAVRFSMFELAADSERSRTDAKGAISSPSSASKRVISLLASSASARTAAGSETVSSAMEAGTAAS